MTDHHQDRHHEDRKTRPGTVHIHVAGTRVIMIMDRGDYRRSYSQDDYYRQYDDRYRGNVMLYLYIYLAHISEQVCIFVIKFLQPGRL